jgi:hypothetical protein
MNPAALRTETIRRTTDRPSLELNPDSEDERSTDYADLMGNPLTTERNKENFEQKEAKLAKFRFKEDYFSLG